MNTYVRTYNEMSEQQYPERNQRIYGLRLKGARFLAIAETFGLTESRVREICRAQRLRGLRSEDRALSNDRHGKFRVYISPFGEGATFEYFSTFYEAQGLALKTVIAGLVRVEQWHAHHACYRGIPWQR